MVSRLLETGVKKKNIDVLRPGTQYNYGTCAIVPFSLHHNVENYGLKICINGEHILYAVDTGYIGDISAPNYDMYLIEANHTEAEIQARIQQKIESGQFIYETEAAKNHLSREQAEAWLAKNSGPKSRWIFLHQHVERSVE